VTPCRKIGFTAASCDGPQTAPDRDEASASRRPGSDFQPFSSAPGRQENLERAGAPEPGARSENVGGFDGPCEGCGPELRERRDGLVEEQTAARGNAEAVAGDAA
jgi:hypothetical protein